jgi:hypothetical protein
MGWRRVGAIVILWAAAAGPAPGAEPLEEAMTVRLSRPDCQAERLIALFEGARAPHPAAALAGWKRTEGRHGRSLGKPLEAAIAAINPEMARELRLLDGAEVGIAFAADGRLVWHAILPRDDGTFAAAGTALALTDGGGDPPLGGVAVDRLGPPGAPLMARTAGALVVAGTRDALRTALGRVREGRTPGRLETGTGGLIRLVPGGLRPSRSLAVQRLAGALLGAGCREAEGSLNLEGETVSLVVTGRFDGPPIAAGAVDPAWLDWVPASGVLGAAAMTLDPRPEAWDAAFAAADRVEKADPARAQAAPLRTRLNLLARAVGVRPEVDLWPRLRGISAGVTVDPAGRIDGVLLALHAVDPAAAERMARGIVPRLATRLGVTPADGPDRPEAEGILRLGRLSGLPLDVCRRDATVLVAWGDRMLAAALDAGDHPERSAGPTIRASWGSRPPQRAGAFWPSGLSGLATEGSPVASSLAGAAPVLWWGGWDGPTSRDEIRWAGLNGLVRRFLDRLPLAPPPEP